MNTFRRSTVSVLLAVALLAAGCGSDSLRYLGEKVKDPERFLASVERGWRSDLTKERVNVHKEARCYFSKAEEAKEIDGLAFCGPARHYVEATESDGGEDLSGTDAPEALAKGVWDTYAFGGNAIEGGYELVNASPETKGAVVPSGVTLVRLDDKVPPTDSDKLAAPPPPPASSGFIGLVSTDSSEGDQSQVDSATISVVSEPEIKDSSTPSGAIIHTPYKNFLLDAVGTTDLVTTEDGTRTPAKGEEFLVARFSFVPGYWQQYLDGSSSDNSFPDEAIVKAPEVLTLATPSARTYLPISESNTLVISVPKGDTTSKLTVTSDGLGQIIEIRSGKLIDAVPPVVESMVGRQYGTQRKVLDDGDHDLAHHATFGNAWRSE